MCVAFYTLEHPDYALVLCSNRDTWLTRPTEDAKFRPLNKPTDNTGDSEEASFVLSGRDTVAGGTWLGINHSGHVALLTNITEPPAKYHTTRGELAWSFLLALGQASSPGLIDGISQDATAQPRVLENSAPTLQAYVSELVATENHKAYAGFNLLLFSPEKTREQAGDIRYDGRCVSNAGGGGDLAARPLRENERRCGGISNGIESLGGADWEKLIKGRAELQRILDHPTQATEGMTSEEKLIVELFQLLSLSRPHVTSLPQLRSTIRVNPVFNAVDPSQTLQAYGKDGDGAHAEPPPYATRVSTVILVKANGEVLFIERDIYKLAENGEVVMGSPNDDRRFRFTLNQRPEAASLPA